MGKDVADDGSLILRHGNVAMLRRLLAHTKVIFFLFYNVLYWMKTLLLATYNGQCGTIFLMRPKIFFEKIY